MSNNKQAIELIEEVAYIMESAGSFVGMFKCFVKLVEIKQLLTENEVEGVEVATTISKMDGKTIKHWCGSCDFMVVKGEDDECRHCKQPIKWPQQK